MTVRRGALVVALVLVTLVGPLLSASPPAAAAAERGRVLIISVPRLTWADIDEHRPPELVRLLSRSAVASMSTRTLGPTTTLGEGYATIGAGNRSGVSEAVAGVAYDGATVYEGSTAAETLERRTGADVEPGSVVHLGAAHVQAMNRRFLYGAEPGSLGQALGYRQVAVVANADVVVGTDAAVIHREAALAVMDHAGRIGGGSVDDSLNMADPSAPFGIRADPRAVLEATAEAWAEHTVVLVEMSDLDRADAYADVTTAARHRLHQRNALMAADDLVGAILDLVDIDRDRVIVVAPAAPRRGEQLTVAAVAGRGVRPGLARSATTRRDGYVTLSDVGPTVVEFVGPADGVPDAMTGTAIVDTGGRAPDGSTYARLVEANEKATFRDRATGPTAVIFIIVQVLAYLLCALILRRGDGRRRRAVAALALTVLLVPPLAFLSGAVRYDRLGLVPYLVVLFAAAFLLGALLSWLTRNRPLLGPGIATGVTLAVLLVDVVSGGRLQINTVFGYSPIVAGRFAGYGNLAFALVAISAIVFTTSMFGAVGGPRRPKLVLVGAVLLVAVVVDGAPAWGSDVGGVLASVPAFIAVMILLGGLELHRRRLVFSLLAGVAAVSIFAMADLARPPESRTHLGRFASTLLNDPVDVLEVLQRKLQTNISILTSSVWTLAIPIALLFLLFVTWRGDRRLHRLERAVPGLRACLVGGLIAGVLGFALNDSGVAVPAMMLAVLLPHLSYLLLTVPAADEPVR